MEIKRLLRFYFKADSLDKAFNNLIKQKALKSVHFGSDCEIIGQEMCALIQAKQELSDLWNYLDGVLKAFSEDEINTLRVYGVTRLGIKQLSPELQKGIHKTGLKFTRHAKNLGHYESGVRMVNRFYGLL